MNKTYRNLLISAFFILYLFVGMALVKDYGIFWDEPHQRKIGGISAVYINNLLGGLTNTKKIEDAANSEISEIVNLDEFPNKHHGAIFEVLLVGFEFAANLKDSRNIYIMRHALTFVMSWIGVIVFFFLVKLIFNDWKTGFIGSLFLILSPRIFAHSFYNSKDLILLSFMIINMYALVRFFKNKTYLTAIMLGFCTAVVIDIRIVGVYIPFVTLFFLSLEAFKSDSTGNYVKKYSTVFLVYLVSLLAFIYLLWPYLWKNPVKNFLQAFHFMKRFLHETTVFYLGELVKTTELPWHYVPIWISVTTPFVYTLLFMVGVIGVLAIFLKNPLKIYNSESEKLNLLILALFSAPLLAVIILHSVLYNSWRHMFFLYPSFIILSLTGFNFLVYIIGKIKTENWKKSLNIGLAALIIINLSSTLLFMIRSHPYQNVYFNFLAGNAAEKFELDYWGLSYKQALEFILESDKRKIINIAVETSPGEYNAKIIERDDRQRINFVPLEKADYYISSFFDPAKRLNDQKKEFPYLNEIFSVNVDNLKIIGVYKLISNFELILP